MTPEQRRQAIDFVGIRGTGMPIPMGHLFASSRAHVVNIYYESPVPAILFFWRNRNLVGGVWTSKSSPSSTWKGKSSPESSWRNRGTPQDGGTQTI